MKITKVEMFLRLFCSGLKVHCAMMCSNEIETRPELCEVTAEKTGFICSYIILLVSNSGSLLTFC